MAVAGAGAENKKFQLRNTGTLVTGIYTIEKASQNLKTSLR